jgi:hypothetical protein
MLERQEPHWAAGFVGTWSIDGDAVGFVERLQAELGGGVYLVRPLRRQANGKKVYAQGAVRVRVAGPPRVQQQQPHVIEATARDRLPERVPSRPAVSELGSLAPMFESIFGKFAERLAGIEQRLNAPVAAAPQPAAYDLTSELRRLAELRKLARELVGMDDAGGDDDDDDDDEQPVAPAAPKKLDLESMIAMYLEGKVNPPAPAAAPAPMAGPQFTIIRNEQQQQQQQQQQAQQQQQPQQQQQQQPTNAREAAAAFAQRLADMPPADALEFLGHVQSNLPPAVIAMLAQAAQQQAQQQQPQQQQQADPYEPDEPDDDAHAQAYR